MKYIICNMKYETSNLSYEIYCWGLESLVLVRFRHILQDILAFNRPALVLPPPPTLTLWHRQNGVVVSESGGKGLNLALRWEPLHSSDSVLKRHFCVPLVAADTSQMVASPAGGVARWAVGVQQLLGFHEHMLALVCAASDHAAIVCLVEDGALVEGSGRGGLADEECARHARVMQQHGLTMAATVREGEMMTWASARGTSGIAVLCADERILHISVAVEAMPGSKVEARATAACGAALFVGDGECCGDDNELLAIPLSMCLRHCDANMDVSRGAAAFIRRGRGARGLVCDTLESGLGARSAKRREGNG